MHAKINSILLIDMAMLVIAMSLLPGCSALQGSNPLEPTLTALNAAVAQTMTAVNQETGGVNSQATAESIAAAQSQLQATQTAQLAVQEQASQATSAAASPIVSELPVYGLDANSGEAGWMHNPLTLDLTAYHDFKYGNDYMNVTAADFVLAGDINWDTQYGGSGCGFMFRSNGDQNNPDQYMVLATRFATGHVVFMALQDGQIANFKDFYPRTEDKSFQIDNGTTNRLAIVARGNLIDIYTNGVKIGSVDTTQPPKRPALPAAPQPPADLSNIPAVQGYEAQIKEFNQQTGQINSNFQLAQQNFSKEPAIFSDGFLAMVALSESGHTICNFNNTWLWQLK
jgi:hypothetical protein